MNIYLRLILLLCFAASAGAQPGAISWKSTEIKPGLYMLEGQGGFAGGNLALLLGDEGAVLIDDGVVEVSDATLASLEALTGLRVRFLINTHAHGDHTGNNAVLHEQGATVVAHDKLRAALLANEEFPAAGVPELTFSDTMTFHVNGQTAHVFHIPRAHTDGDAAVMFRELNVLHSGDVLFNGIFPFIDLDGGGSVDGYIAGQKKLIAMVDAETEIIPGHGPRANKIDLIAASQMLINARARVKALVDNGASKEEVMAANPLAPYENWSWGFITTERMTETLYRDLTD